MKKLKLNVEVLRVESFQTSRTDRAFRGTIRGLQDPAEPMDELESVYTADSGCTVFTVCACSMDGHCTTNLQPK